MADRDNIAMFRRDRPSDEELAAFERDGYIAFKDIFNEPALKALVDEVERDAPVRAFLDLSDEDRMAQGNPLVYFVRPWDDRGYWSDRLIDEPLITALLASTIGADYHFCHSAMNLSLPGAGPLGFHQDHHHWNHENPINLAEREKGYIQILYYPNGFTRGDRNLSVIAGSHKVSPTSEVTPEGMIRGDFNAQAGRALEVVDLELPPGSFIYLNARTFHAVSPKPEESAQRYRIFLIDIFKQNGPPHRYTQEIPQAWLDGASPARKRMFDREPWTEASWTLS